MYVPKPVPSGDLTNYLAGELAEIARTFQTPSDALLLTTIYAEPKIKRDGMVVLADGTSWNPGSGAGFYGYRAGAWVLLG